VKTSELHRLSETLWEIPVSRKAGMLVPARIVASRGLVEAMDDAVTDQITNVATLPGIVEHAWCMPDGHSGYGFPIGGMAAFDPASGVISPGGIGFDINCGMRLVRTDLSIEEVRPRLVELVDRLFARIPAGVGRNGFVNVSRDEFREMTELGAEWCLRRELAIPEDLERTEERGRMRGADAAAVSDEAVERGYRQVGTLGSGNHYLEIQVAKREDIVDPDGAAAMGIDRPGQVLLMLHCGSRGFGHQVASEYLKEFLRLMPSRGIQVRDKQLACAPLQSREGQAYFAAMQCAVNMAFINRQVILHRIREVFSDVFGKDPLELGIRQIYDVTHNTAKLERHVVGGATRELLVHRKGATRALGPGDPELPEAFRSVGQPVIIGGSMETGSYLLAGVSTGSRTFSTTAHGSGRLMGRNEAKRRYRGQDLRRSMAERGIYVRTVSDGALAEEAGAAYKSIDEVVAATEQAGISRRIARLVPVGNIKG
jgi:tRNA-splicing ligase RtcB (3'-phosphate/5'-hydroxy nucleic acid ligase)